MKYITSGAGGCSSPYLVTPRLPGKRVPSGPATSEVLQGNNLRPEAAGSCQSQILTFMHPEASSSSGKDHHLPTGARRDHPPTCSTVFASHAPSVPSEGPPLEDVARAAEIAEEAFLEEEIMAAEDSTGQADGGHRLGLH